MRPLGVGHVDDVAEVQDAGDVDQQVDRPVDAVDDRLHLIHIGHVGRMAHDGPVREAGLCEVNGVNPNALGGPVREAGLGEVNGVNPNALGGPVREAGLGEVDGVDANALGGEGDGDRAPDAPGRAGHDRCPVRQAVDRPVPVQGRGHAIGSVR
ncbi:hypothetical protein GCM10010443_19160 [Actinoplanes cyaneus]